jgi:hypothetical protein
VRRVWDGVTHFEEIRLAQQPIELGLLLMCAPYPGGQGLTW